MANTARLNEISYIEREIVINPNNNRYEINGLDLTNSHFLYRKSNSTFVVMARGDYRILDGNGSNNKILEITNANILKTSEKIQIITKYDFNANLYTNPTQATAPTLAINYNGLYQAVYHLWKVFRQQGMIGDALDVDLILPTLKDGQIWIRKGDHYEGIGLEQFNANVKSEIDKSLKKCTDELNRIKENHINALTSHNNILKNTLTTTKDNLIGDFEREKNRAVSAINAHTIDKKRELEILATSVSGEINNKQIEVFHNIESRSQETIDDILSKVEREKQLAEIELENMKRDFLSLLDNHKVNVANQIANEINAMKTHGSSQLDNILANKILEANIKVSQETNKAIITEIDNSKTIFNELIDRYKNEITRNSEYGINELIDAKSRYADEFALTYDRFKISITKQIEEAQENLDEYETMKYYEFLEKCNRIIYGILGELKLKAHNYIQDELAGVVKKHLDDNVDRFKGPRGFRGDVGPEGPQGPPGEDGENGIYIPVSGFVSFGVRNGHLIMKYSGDNPPNFRINEDGDLVYDFDEVPDSSNISGPIPSPSPIINLENYDGDIRITGSIIANENIHARGTITSETQIASMPTGRIITNIERTLNNKIKITFSDGTINEV